MPRAASDDRRAEFLAAALRRGPCTSSRTGKEVEIMANIIKKQDTTTPTHRRTWDPWQMMRDALLDPFGAMTPRGQMWNPSFEVRETEDAFLFKADLPGIKDDDVEIELNGSRLAISGKREAEHEDREGDTVYAYERSFGSFYRAFNLPDNVDTENVSCDLKSGVLTLVVPKKEGPQPKKIQIGKGQKA
jgi:HSP20 family protein